jgi:hypothetical protein
MGVDRRVVAHFGFGVGLLLIILMSKIVLPGNQATLVVRIGVGSRRFPRLGVGW